MCPNYRFIILHQKQKKRQYKHKNNAVMQKFVDVAHFYIYNNGDKSLQY